MTKLKFNYSSSTALPNSELIEKSVLNILLTNPNLITQVTSNLHINSFYSPIYQKIYKALLNLREKESSINITILITFLQDQGKLEEIGGIKPIFDILNGFENASELDNYVKSLNENYLRRLIIEFGKEIITLGYINTISLEDIIEKIENFLSNLNKQTSNDNKIHKSYEIITELYEEIKRKMYTDENNGLKTSFNDLDSILQGLQKSDLIIIAGRPSMGKTAFSLNLGQKIVEKYNLPLVIFSLEMSRQQIIYRFISSDAKINGNRLKSNKMTDLEWKRLSESMNKLSKLPIYIDDNPNLTISEIRSTLRKIFLQKKENGLVIIDYLQLMKLNNNLENRVQEISYITRNLKILAKEFQIPILVLSQLSRSIESRLNKRPMLSDLRESGCISKKNINDKLHSWNKYEIISHNKKQFFFKGIKPIYLLSFENNVQIYLTSNHKILSEKGWIRVFEIKEKIGIYSLIYSKKINTKNNYHFNQIKKIEYIGLQPVYDRMIPIYHNYIKENIILHNSIEQDADIVIMLYRDDYYNENTENNNITEFIVSKHRNGPVGTARLIFQPEFTNFKNL